MWFFSEVSYWLLPCIDCLFILLALEGFDCEMEGVASRFACLKDDDTTDWIKPKDKSKKTKSSVVNNDVKSTSAKAKKKNQSNNEAKELQQLAFQTSNKKKNKNKTKSKEENKKSSHIQDSQYHEWKEKDEQVS